MPPIDVDRRPRRRRPRGSAALALVAALGLLGGGCSSDGEAPAKASPKPASSSATAAPATTEAADAKPATYPLAHLRSRPCLALDERDVAALGISGPGERSSSKNGAACDWLLDGQNVGLDLDVPQSYAKTMTKDGRVTQVPVGKHMAVQAEFQGICFIFVAVEDIERLVGTTTIPEPGASQDGTCPAGAAVAAAALTHIR
ncbi:DUF3558 family protein [Streptomyces phytophilus]|uniref:DUF3558 family protein n=1 Tax=Streptomyces phytophilus TaxID=722715 RepID=UPI0015F0DACE|nr:DUF3558 family protein [Streptomyces phytophilus]